MKLLRQLWSFAGAFIFVAFLWIALVLMKLFGRIDLRKKLQLWGYHMALHFWSLHVKVEGELETSPVFLVSNHCSYIDVAVLGSIGHMRFTPKSDVKSWPLIGSLVQAFDVIFVDRVPGKAKEAQQTLMQALKGGDRICVFPEGTTSNGRMLKPFKPTLFSLAERWEGDIPLKVQPLVVDYHAVNGQPIDDAGWDIIAWFGDEDLISHLWRFCGLQRIDVTLHCLPSVALLPDESRKELSERVRVMISQKIPHLTVENT